jgi:hypothetical protein
MTSQPAIGERIRSSLAYCARPQHLRRTISIAVIVGTLLTLVNQGGVIFGGDATAATWVRTGMNYLIPFCVSNAGLLSARR